MGYSTSSPLPERGRKSQIGMGLHWQAFFAALLELLELQSCSIYSFLYNIFNDVIFFDVLKSKDIILYLGMRSSTLSKYGIFGLGFNCSASTIHYPSPLLCWAYMELHWLLEPGFQQLAASFQTMETLLVVSSLTYILM